MIFSFEAAMCQVNDLMHRYKDLKISSYDDNQIIVQGIINVNRKCNDYTLYHNYHLKVIVPINSDELPHAIEVGNQINNNYVHRYPDGELCLDTDTAIRIRFVNGFSLCDWMYEYVETYFFSYEYYQRYGIFPFGERAHGLMGILQTYEEILKLSDYTSAIRFMYSISKEKYRGHLLCPCGSGIILRKCHGETVYKYYADERLNKIVSDDFKMIRKEIEEYDKKSGNKSKTKRS